MNNEIGAPNVGCRAWMKLRMLASGLALVAITACGGGSDGPSTPTMLVPPATPLIPLTVRTVDTSGVPVAGATVRLNGNDYEMSGTSDADGKATFGFVRTPKGEASASAWSPTHRAAERRFQLGIMPADPMQLTLIRLEQATPKVTGNTAAISADAATLTIDVEISVTDENAGSIDTLTLSDFSPPYRRGATCDGITGGCIEPSDPPIEDWWPAPGPNPVAATLTGIAPAAFYRVRFVLNANPGTFMAGRTVNAVFQVRLGIDTWAWLELPVRL